MDTSIPEFLAEAANRRVSDIFIIAGRPLAEKIDGHLLDRTHITGTTKDGQEVTIFVNGEWAF